MPPSNLHMHKIALYVILSFLLKMCYAELYNMYYNMEKKCTCDQLFDAWWIDPTINIQFVVFYFMGKQYMMHKGCPLIVVFAQDAFPSSLIDSNVSLK
jgi:hypothetical protein